MFKWLFYYWYNVTDTPSIISKVNVWSFINIRTFKTKISSTIVYFILSLNNIKFKKLKIFYKNINFDYFYIKIIIVLIYIYFFFFLLFFY